MAEKISSGRELISFITKEQKIEQLEELDLDVLIHILNFNHEDIYLNEDGSFDVVNEISKERTLKGVSFKSLINKASETNTIDVIEVKKQLLKTVDLSLSLKLVEKLMKLIQNEKKLDQIAKNIEEKERERKYKKENEERAVMEEQMAKDNLKFVKKYRV